MQELRAELCAQPLARGQQGCFPFRTGHFGNLIKAVKNVLFSFSQLVIEIHFQFFGKCAMDLQNFGKRNRWVILFRQRFKKIGNATDSGTHEQHSVPVRAPRVNDGSNGLPLPPVRYAGAAKF